jgi:hypothetical protein
MILYDYEDEAAFAICYLLGHTKSTLCAFYCILHNVVKFHSQAKLDVNPNRKIYTIFSSFVEFSKVHRC